MVNEVGKIKISDLKSLGKSWNKLVLSEITVYEDPLMDDNTVYRGKKANGPSFLIVSKKVSKLISNIILKRERRDKLKRINEH